jgi:tetratricopeptide (TPR) repeat protein
LDPRLPTGYTELGTVYYRRGKWAASEDLLRQALALDPDNPQTLHRYGTMLASTGRLKDALPIRIQLRTLEPFADPIYNVVSAQIMRNAGQDAAGIAILEAVSSSYLRDVALATAYAGAGRYAEAEDTLLLRLKISGTAGNPVLRKAVEDAARILRSAPTKVKAPQDIPALNSEVNFVYAHVGALDRVIEYPERGVKVGELEPQILLIWDPLYAPLRKTERFKTLMRDAGLVDYWRTRGWPDLCRPIGANDFACE